MDLDTLDLRKLRAFYLVARHGSLSRAASKLNITMSAVSFSIRRLEEQLGLQLFQRLPNRLVLTAAGERFAVSAEAIFDGIGKIIADSTLEATPSGRMSIAVNSDLAWYFIPKISDFLKLYPDIELGIYIRSSSDTQRAVERGEIDMGIGRFVKVSTMLDLEPIIESSISLVCPPDHPLARRRMPRLQEIARYKLVSLSGNLSSRRMIDAAFAKAGVMPGSFIEAGNCQTACEFVEAGIGVGLVHTFCTQRPTLANLHFCDLSRYLGTGTFSAIYQKAGSHPVLFKRMRDALLAPSAHART